jgi:DNA mismatch endonuclease (patch repair protein)
MSRIKGKNTKPELLVRPMLHRMGYRFRCQHLQHPRNTPRYPEGVLPIAQGCEPTSYPG